MKISNCFHHFTLFFTIFLLLAMTAGCIISEYDEYEIILNADGKSGTIFITKYNLQSDRTDSIKQKEDFDDLIKDWKGDQYLLDKMKEGTYVKSRKLYLKKEKLVWKEKAIFSDIYQWAGDIIANDTLRIGFGREETVTKTNGIMIQTRDSTIVQWPLKMKNFVLKIQRNNFDVKSDLSSMFKKYTSKR
jgi:hypothetical protein